MKTKKQRDLDKRMIKKFGPEMYDKIIKDCEDLCEEMKKTNPELFQDDTSNNVIYVDFVNKKRIA